MRIAALYDIHGNLPALEAVLAEITESDIDHIVVGGDILPGPMPMECLTLLSDLDTPVDALYGNGETDTLVAFRGEELARVPVAFHETILWVANQLDEHTAQRLTALPATLLHTLPHLGNVLFCHATPRNDNELFTVDTPAERLTPVFEPTGADVVICCHTHMQFDRQVGSVRVVNAGSVGMPFGEPGAYWLVVDDEGIDFRRTSYDLDAAADRINATGYPFDADPREPPGAEQMLAVFEAASLR